MKKNKDCSAIRDMIEENIIRKNVGEHTEIQEHIKSCMVCEKYMSDLVMLQPTTGYHYTLPDSEKGKFPALVRTRIETRKYRNRKPSYVIRPAFQIALMMLVVVSVVFYLFRSETDNTFFSYQTDIEYIDIYSSEYQTYIVHDEELISLFYSKTFFDEDFSVHGSWYNGYYRDDYYDSTDDLTEEEIDYIIQRLGEV
jgi:hypothetical protein